MRYQYKGPDRNKSIPSTIKNLKKLHNLVLDRNRINYLPKELGECESLRMLHLRNDSITSGQDLLLPVEQIVNLIKRKFDNNFTR